MMSVNYECAHADVMISRHSEEFMILVIFMNGGFKQNRT